MTCAGFLSVVMAIACWIATYQMVRARAWILAAAFLVYAVVGTLCAVVFEGMNELVAYMESMQR